MALLLISIAQPRGEATSPKTGLYLFRFAVQGAEAQRGIPGYRRSRLQVSGNEGRVRDLGQVLAVMLTIVSAINQLEVGRMLRYQFLVSRCHSFRMSLVETRRGHTHFRESFSQRSYLDLSTKESRSISIKDGHTAYRCRLST